MAKDPHGVLGVPQGASEAAIRDAYRKLAKQYHPDLNPNDPSAAQKMHEINGAYRMLRSQQRIPSAASNIKANYGKKTGNTKQQTVHNARSGFHKEGRPDYNVHRTNGQREDGIRNDGSKRHNRRSRAYRFFGRLALTALFLYLSLSFFSNTFLRLFSGEFNVNHALDPHNKAYYGIPISGYRNIQLKDDWQD